MTATVSTASARKPLRQPMVALTQASGVAAARVPTLEAANTQDSGAASLAGGNQREHMTTTAMKEAAQPSPTTVRPMIRPVASLALAIRTEPAALSMDSAVTVRRAP